MSSETSVEDRVPRLRLRQIALATRDLDATVDALGEALDLHVCFVDRRVAHFGVRNSVLALGDQYLEVLTPTRPDATSARFLGRSGGDAAYMVILQVLSDRSTSEHLAGLGIRVAHDFVSHGYEGFQLHPKDTPGMFLELGRQLTDDRYDPHGAWMPSGPDGPASRRSALVHAMTALEIAVEDPAVAAALLARFNGTEPVGSASAGRAVAVVLENATLRFVPVGADARVGVRTVELAASGDVEPVTIAGVRFAPSRSL